MNLTAFHLAAENGHFEVVEVFLNYSDAFVDFIALHHASKNGHLQVVQLLLQHGVQDNCLKCDGQIY